MKYINRKKIKQRKRVKKALQSRARELKARLIEVNRLIEKTDPLQTEVQTCDLAKLEVEAIAVSDELIFLAGALQLLQLR